MSRFLLVPEDGDMSKSKQIQLPPNLYDRGKESEMKESLVGGSLKNASVNIEKKNQNISNDLIYATKNLVLAKKLASFLQTNGFHIDDAGQLIYQGKIYPVDLEKNFVDLVDGLKQPPRGYKILYKLLKEAGLEYISDHRMKYY